MIEKIEELEERFDNWLNNNVTTAKTVIILGTILAFGIIASSVAI